MNIELYPHNQETYQKIIESWLTDNRVATVQATGTGKSMLILKCLFTYPSVNKIVLAPSHHILNQLAGKVDELPNTTLMTYAKLSKMSQDDISSLNVKIIVLDEFHRCGAKSWGDGVSKLIAHHPDAKILGTTATPIRYLDGERDMTDELFDGKVVTNLNLPQAIVKDILPMPHYISALYTYDEEILNLHEKINNSSNSNEEKDDMRKEVEQMKKKLDKSKGIPVILKKHLGTKSGKFIVFCRDKKHLFEMKETVVQWFIKGKVTNNVVDYSIYTGKSGNNKIIKEFRNADPSESIHLLFVIDKLNEGLHVDDIDGVIFLRSTMSPIIYYQQLGRAMKVNGHKPYIFDLVNNFSSLGSKGFAKDIEDEVEKENKQRKERGEKELELSDFVIYDEMQDVIGLFDSVESRLRDNWSAMFERYISGEDSKEISIWKYTQRQNCRSGTMSIEKINRLNRVNFVWDQLDEHWNEMFQKYVSKEESVDIRNWERTQRKYFKSGKMEQYRIDKLNSVDFEWEPKESSWNQYFDICSSYSKQHGHLNIANSCIIDGMKVGRWVQEQRQNFNNRNLSQEQKQKYKRGTLSEERVDKLNSIGFLWNTHEIEWNEKYDLLVKYKSIYDHCNMSKVFEMDGIKLGLWATTQRQRYRQGKLSNGRIDKLNSIGFEWKPKLGPSKTKQLQTI